MSLHCKLVPVQYREYEYGLFYPLDQMEDLLVVEEWINNNSSHYNTEQSYIYLPPFDKTWLIVVRIRLANVLVEILL